MTYFLGIVSTIKTILFLQINSVLFSVKYQKRVKVFSLLPASCLNPFLKVSILFRLHHLLFRNGIICESF